MRKCNNLAEVLDTSVCPHGAEKNNMCGKVACLKVIFHNNFEIIYMKKCIYR